MTSRWMHASPYAAILSTCLVLAGCDALSLVSADGDTWYPGEDLPWSEVLDVDADGTALVSFHDNFQVVPGEGLLPASPAGELPGVALVTSEDDVTVLAPPQQTGDEYQVWTHGSLRDGTAAWSFVGHPSPPDVGGRIWVSDSGAAPIELTNKVDPRGLALEGFDAFSMHVGLEHVFVLGTWSAPDSGAFERGPFALPIDGSPPSATRTELIVHWIHRDLCAQARGEFAVTYSASVRDGDSEPSQWLQQWTISETPAGISEPVRVASPARGSTLKVPMTACGSNAAAPVEIDGHGTFISYRQGDTYNLEPHAEGLCCGDVFLSEDYLASVVFRLGDDGDTPPVSLTDLRDGETVQVGQGGDCNRLILTPEHIAFGDGQNSDGSCRIGVRALTDLSSP